MSTPEVHVHVHFHSQKAEDDILTEHTYVKPTPPPHPEQLDFSADSGVNEQVPQPGAPEQTVAITPQTVLDQRLEVANYSQRNKHLVKVDTHISAANKRESAAELVRQGRLSGYSSESLDATAEKEKGLASVELASACGHCALECSIRGNFGKWSRIHHSADEAKTTGQESRRSWRKRLVKDPEAHCLPGQKTKKPGDKKNQAA